MALIACEGLRIFVGCCSRRFSISSVQRSWERQGRFMNKLLSHTVERKIRDSPRSNIVLDNKRTAVLNTLYMQNVSEALSFGGFSEIDGKGIQLTHVAVKNSGVVEVHWTAGETEDHVEIQNILSSIAGKVRNHLMFAAMLGNVPRIVFKEDVSTRHLNRTMQELHKVSLELEAMKKNSKTEEMLEDEEDFARVAPLMRMDTLGLPYDKIFWRIKEAAKNCYPVQVPVPPTPEEFNALLQPKSGTPTQSPEAQIQKKKELHKFVKLYQKSALSSCTRKNNFEDRSKDIFYYNDDVDDDDIEDHRR